MQWFSKQFTKAGSSKMRRQAIRSLRDSGKPNAVATICDCLEDSDLEVCLEAIDALDQIKDERGVKPLIDSLKDERKEVRIASLHALRHFEGEEIITPISRCLNDKISEVRTAAARALDSLGWEPNGDKAVGYFVSLGKYQKAAMYGSQAIKPLVELLKSGVYHQQLRAIEYLSQIDDPEVVKPLLQALKDKDTVVRCAAAEALGKIGDEAAVAPILAMLRENNPKLRRAAAEALGRLGSDDATDPLIRLLEDANWEVRLAALQAIRRLPGEKVDDAFVSRLSDFDKDVRLDCVTALGDRKCEKAVPRLIVALTDEEIVIRNAARDSLRKINFEWKNLPGAKEALPQLNERVDHSDYWVSQSAKKVIEELTEAPQKANMGIGGLAMAHGYNAKRHPATELLTGLLGDTDPMFRQAAAEALGRIADKSAIEPLAQALDDTDPWVKKSAAVALDQNRWETSDASIKVRQLIMLEKWDDVVFLAEKAVPFVIKELQASQHKVRAGAAKCLGEIGVEQAKEPLSQLLRDTNLRVRQAASLALKINEWMPAEIDLAVRHSIEQRDWNEVAKLSVETIAPLVDFLRNKENDRADLESAEAVLSRVENPELLPALVPLLEDVEISRPILEAVSRIVVTSHDSLSEEGLYSVVNLRDPEYRVYHVDEFDQLISDGKNEKLDASGVRERAREALKERGLEAPNFKEAYG